ncbi:MAG: ParD-like family protein [Candidatus Riflebacteria bacterium]|nr:ParD-like family protein [Candidatus Riflebacteria bacterium]
MAIAIKISDALISDARVYSKVNNRSLTGQIEFWAKIGKCSEENPDLTYDQIKEILLGLVELHSGHKIEYKFG